ncbi:MAG TPA: hypothetical protein VFZ25_19240 [Chloroflexota bacterium]|nr:hypothetical protein [Chloroflexota bacterium]
MILTGDDPVIARHVCEAVGLNVARALLHQPGLVVLGESTTGLDPQTRELTWMYLRGLPA